MILGSREYKNTTARKIGTAELENSIVHWQRQADRAVNEAEARVRLLVDNDGWTEAEAALESRVVGLRVTAERLLEQIDEAQRRLGIVRNAETAVATPAGSSKAKPRARGPQARR